MYDNPKVPPGKVRVWWEEKVKVKAKKFINGMILPESQVCKYASMQECKYANMQGCKKSTTKYMQVCN